MAENVLVRTYSYKRIRESGSRSLVPDTQDVYEVI